jgi:D-alanyl-D-alanine carboxypeptidase/D-alanyl-D-alanine-endopeptidase (penicillin-binding protein 4)
MPALVPRHHTLVALLLCALAAVAALMAIPPAPAVAAPARASGTEAQLPAQLRGAMRLAGSSSGAYVVNSSTGRPVFGFKARRPRILASNTKLFTTAAALARFGTDATLHTDVRGTGELRPDGTYRGSLYLVGGGDPTFGSERFSSRAYGGGASVQTLAAKLESVGIERVSGRVYGDESGFDTRRGGPESGFSTSIYVGPLSALAYNRGLASESGRGGFQSNPPLSAAAALDAELERRGIGVGGRPAAAAAPRPSTLLAIARSPSMERLAALTNKPSDNFFAETLVKDLALQASGRGTTAGGTRLAAAFARRLGGGPARLADGSGLSRANRASPLRVVRLLLALQRRDESRAFFRSLAIAGRDGTLAPRMRSGPARNRCRGKTGTISGVSALSGYCRALSGQTYAFSILMNGVGATGARALQDRMAQAIAGVR